MKAFVFLSDALQQQGQDRKGMGIVRMVRAGRKGREGSSMNGEMFQICMLVNAVRNAMEGKKEFTYSCEEYVNSMSFSFLPQGKGEEPREVSAPREWYEGCIRKGVNDMKFLAPLKYQDRSLLGSANAGRTCIAAFQGDGAVTYWTAVWEFDSILRKWNVGYRENRWKEPPAGKPRFRDNTAEFLDVLLRIGEFAEEIECGDFAGIFRNAWAILSGREEIPDRHGNGRPVTLPDFPESRRRMFYAASKADVFGAMGSWNDSPPYCAHIKGLDDMYDRLSDELLMQIRLAVLFAVNESGKGYREPPLSKKKIIANP